MIPHAKIKAVAPNLKKRLSGVTSTILALVPVMGKDGVVATGPGLPPETPHISLWRAATMPRDRWRVWHARRNTEMLVGVLLRRALGRKYKLLFTSAAQRDHSGYTKRLIRQMDAVIATSSLAAQYLERDATVIRHGIDIDRFSPPSDKGAVRRQLGLPEDDIFLGCFGRVRENKGTDLFVDAAIEICRADRRVRAAILGRTTDKNAAFKARLEQNIRNAGLHHRIRFVGEVPGDDLSHWFQAMDVFVAPQRWEGFGLTPLEAMACAVPVVATRVGAFEEQILDGETGHLVDAGDLIALTARIKDVLSDDVRRAKMGQSARTHVETTFPLVREAREIMAIYDRLLAD